MPNLVGIGNSQVPTNAMLGRLAYQDSVGEINIDKIKARTSDTAIDIFVYDTRKDSDSGAWRHRTQNTSWYNEGASQYRGARKEFPAVAVIVVTSGNMTIYDGDDPTLPMWMIFTSSNTTWLKHTSSGPNSVVALNGNVVTCGSGTGRLSVVNFISDDGYVTEPSFTYRHSGIITRNSTGVGPSDTVNPLHIVNIDCNDVAITVLPNAPINEYTGLPTPTIAVATDGGVSVIKDDGNVFDITHSTGGYLYVTQIKIDEKFVYIGFGASNSYIGGIGYAVPIPSADVSLGGITGSTSNADFRWSNNSTSGSGGQSDYYINPSDINDDDVKGMVLTKRGMSFGTESGASILLNNQRDTNGSVAFITSSFNTGYMHGDIRGAFLSDTNDTNITNSSELITNGGFDSNINNWTYSGTGGATHTNGQIQVTGDVGNIAYQDVSGLVVGEVYVISGQITGGTNGQISVYPNALASSGAGILAGSGNVVQSTYNGTFTAVGTTVNVRLVRVSSTVTYDNISLRKAELNRSITGRKPLYGETKNALQVIGTIHKNPVATGAELVSYSNFSNSNYLLQPYMPDLNFTDTMSIMFWVKDWVGSDSLLHRGPGTTRNSKTSFHLYCSYDYNYRITFTTNGSTEQSFEFNHTANLSGWQCVCFTLSGGTVRGFRNGVEQTLNQTSFSGNIFSQATDQNGLWIGTGPVGGAADTASLALLRLSASAPSAEQVKKIYNDEKCLFHENAKCTLHGTSDDVIALAFDDTNDILHAGTSAGRSDFRGLNRINNTTTAVTTAISASNGLVAEQ